MKTKNVFNKSGKIAILLGAGFLILQDRINGIAFAAGGGAVNDNCQAIASRCSETSFFITTILFIFLMLVLWLISPVGILFFLSSKTLFSKEASVLKRKIARAVRGIAFLTWASLMTIMLIVYLDSLSYNILNFKSAVLDFAIMAGFAFLFIMLAVCVMEKKAIVNDRRESNKKKEDDKEKERVNSKKESPGRNKKINNNTKIAGAKTGGGIKAKIRRKLKEDLKEIVDDEIEKRL